MKLRCRPHDCTSIALCADICGSVVVCAVTVRQSRRRCAHMPQPSHCRVGRSCRRRNGAPYQVLHKQLHMWPTMNPRATKLIKLSSQLVVHEDGRRTSGPAQRAALPPVYTAADAVCALSGARPSPKQRKLASGRALHCCTVATQKPRRLPPAIDQQMNVAVCTPYCLSADLDYAAGMRRRC